MSKRAFELSASNFYLGYVGEEENRKKGELAPPSQNVRIDIDGSARTRNGHTDTGWDLGESSRAIPYRMEESRFGVTFFACDDKVYYKKDTSTTIYDTGISYTAGTLSSFDQHFQNVFVTNSTDGMYRILVTSLSGAVAAVDTTIDLDPGSGIFCPASGNLRVNGTNIAYTSVTGDQLTLTTNAGAAYSDGEIAVIVVDLKATLPKGSKVVFWKERMGILGVLNDAAADNAKRMVFWSKFAGSDTWENIYDFTYGSGGSTKTVVGTRGVLKNAIASEDYIYYFSEDACYKTNVSGVAADTGVSGPTFFQPIGCVNQYCAAVKDDAVMTYDGKRWAMFRKSPDTGAWESVKDFDWAISPHLLQSDADQTDAVMFYSKEKNLTFLDCNVAGERRRFIRDHTPIFDREGVLISEGRWLPPDTNLSFGGYFEYEGKVYATALTDDTIYEIETGYDDNGSEIECTIASGTFRLESDRITADFKDLFIAGAGTEGTTVYIQPEVGGTVTVEKTIVVSSDIGGGEIGSGDETLGGSSEPSEFVEFDVNKPPYPSKGRSFKFVSSCFGDGNAFKIHSWKVTAKAYGTSHTTRS